MFEQTTFVERISKAISAEFLTQLLEIIIRLLLVPMFIQVWGVSKYSYWLVFTSFAQWIHIFDFGSQLYFINQMTRLYVTKNFTDYSKNYSTGIFFFTILGTALFLILQFVIWVSPVNKWLNIEDLALVDTRLILSFLSFKYCFSLTSGLILGVFKSIGKQALSVMLINLSLGLQLVFSFTLLYFDRSMVELASMEVIPLLVTLFVASMLLPKDVELFKFSNIKLDIFKKAIRPSLGFFGIQMSNIFSTQGILLILVKTQSTAIVVAFSTMRSLANLFPKGVSILVHSIWPEITRLYVLKDFKTLEKYIKNVLMFISVCILGYSLTLVVSGDFIFKYLLKKKVDFVQAQMTLILSVVLLNSFWKFGSDILMATNNHLKFAYQLMIVNFISSLSFYFVSKHKNLEFAIFSLVLLQTIPLSVIVFSGVKKHFSSKISKDFISPFLLSAVILLSVNWVSYSWPILVLIAVFLFSKNRSVIDLSSLKLKR